MLAIPSSLRMQFEEHLRNKSTGYSICTLFNKMTKGLPLFLHNHNHPNEPKKPPPVHKEITVRQV
jgi:hypothetical protein